MRPSYSLVDESWIPCRMPDGSVAEVGLREVLLRAHEIVELSDPSPLVTSALLRFLLCVVHRFSDGPWSQKGWLDIWERGAFDRSLVDAYLHRWSERFDLFHPAHPFLQVRDFVTLKGGESSLPKPLSVLSHELASANNTTLFDHSLDREAPAKSPAWCARRLLALQAWALGGGVQPASNLGNHPNARHAPVVGKMQVFLQRRNLFETMVSNLLILEDLDEWCRARGDRPIWERDDVRPVTESPTWPDGLCDYLTFPSRYVRMVPPTASSAVEVRGVYLSQGLYVPPELHDPYTAWCVSADKTMVYPLSLSTDKDVWRDSAALFAWERSGTRDLRDDGRPRNFVQADTDEIYKALGGDAVMHIRVFGLASDQAKPLAWCSRDIPFPARILRDHEQAGILRDTLHRINQAGACLRQSFERLIRSMLEAAEKRADGKQVGRIRDHLTMVCGFWPVVERGFGEFMGLLADSPEEARRRWLEQTKGAATAAFARAVDSLPGRASARLRAQVGAAAWLQGGLQSITRIEEAP